MSGRAGLRPEPVSRAFPGWTAEEIHLALNEAELSEDTAGVLNRVGRLLGAEQGTGPEMEGVSEHLVAAALECRDQEHFVQLLLARRDQPARRA